MYQHWLHNQPQSFIGRIMQSQDSDVPFMCWSNWSTCFFAILITLQGFPVTVTWLAREYACVCCIIEMQKECWRGIGEAVGSWERPLCLLVHQGTETSHCESGLSWVCVLSITFPPPYRSPAQPRTREGKESGFSLMGHLEHAQELSEERSQSAWKAVVELPFMILSHFLATSNLYECYRVIHYLHHHHEKTIRVHSLMAGVWL